MQTVVEMMEEMAVPRLRLPRTRKYLNGEAGLWGEQTSG